MGSEQDITIPREWLELTRITGTILVLGDTDSGKSTLVRWLVQELSSNGGTTGWLDGDIGQTSLWMPTTMNLTLWDNVRDMRESASFFVGSTNAWGRGAPILTGLELLRRKAGEKGAANLVVDTTGFVDRSSGGLALKEWKIELLRPDAVIALQHARELEPVIAPLRKHPVIRVQDLKVAPQARRKNRDQRAANRRRKFREYFESAVSSCLEIARYPVYNLPRARRLSLAGLLDAQGLCLGLGVVTERTRGELVIFTPLQDFSRVVSVRISETQLDPATGLEIA